MRMGIKTFRLRLTLWYLGCFALLFSGLTAGLYGVLSRAMVGRLDESLVSQAATAAALLQDEMEESHGDVPASAHEAVANMRLRVSKVAILQARNSFWPQAGHSTPPLSRAAPAPRWNRRSNSKTRASRSIACKWAATTSPLSLPNRSMA